LTLAVLVTALPAATLASAALSATLGWTEVTALAIALAAFETGLIAPIPGTALVALRAFRTVWPILTLRSILALGPVVALISLVATFRPLALVAFSTALLDPIGPVGGWLRCLGTGWLGARPLLAIVANWPGFRLKWGWLGSWGTVFRSRGRPFDGSSRLRSNWSVFGRRLSGSGLAGGALASRSRGGLVDGKRYLLLGGFALSRSLLARSAGPGGLLSRCSGLLATSRSRRVLFADRQIVIHFDVEKCGGAGVQRGVRLRRFVPASGGTRDRLEQAADL
jgi:hypothetical protein